MTFPNVQALKPHVSVNVRDLDASLAFYRRMLGVEPVKVRPGYAKFDLANPPLNFAINQVAGLASAGALSHLGIQVASTDDVLAVRERWIEAGLLTRDEMGTDCCWARQDKTWVHDPDGNEWEVFVVLEDGLETSVASAGCCGTPDEEETPATKAAGCGCNAQAAG